MLKTNEIQMRVNLIETQKELKEKEFVNNLNNIAQRLMQIAKQAQMDTESKTSKLNIVNFLERDLVNVLSIINQTVKQDAQTIQLYETIINTLNSVNDAQ